MPGAPGNALATALLLGSALALGGAGVTAAACCSAGFDVPHVIPPIPATSASASHVLFIPAAYRGGYAPATEERPLSPLPRQEER